MPSRWQRSRFRDSRFDGSRWGPRKGLWDAASSARFDPLTLFPLGTEGGWWQARLDALWQDQHGLTQVTAAAQQAGLFLSRERWGNDDFATVMAARTEHFQNGAIGLVGTATAATYNTTTGEGVVHRGASVGNQSFVQWTGLTANSVHRADIENTGAQNVLVRSGGPSDTALLTIAPGQRLNGFFLVGALGTITFTSGPNNSTASFTCRSFKRVPSFRALQGTESARPTWRTGPNRFETDASDDRWRIVAAPSTAGTLIFAGTMKSASRVLMGSRPASDGMCYLGTNANGDLCGAIGTQGFSTITAAGDVRNNFGVYALTWSGTEVSLWKNGLLAYRAAQSGAVNTTIPIALGALNNNGTDGSFAQTDAYDFFVLNYVPTDAQMAALPTAW